METQSVSSATSAATTTTTASSDTDAASISADFDTFLQLLTAQLENQDPLEPIDSTDFVAQLAQFSAVEQQVLSNENLSAILEAVGGGASGLSAWLDTEVRAPAPVRFDGAPVSLEAPNSAPEATEAALVVRDEEGGFVTRIPVDPQAATFEWDGTNANGAPAAPGFYSFTLERLENGEPLASVTPKGFSRVVEARLDGDDTLLVLESGTSVGAGQVTAVRSPTPVDEAVE